MNSDLIPAASGCLVSPIQLISDGRSPADMRQESYRGRERASQEEGIGRGGRLTAMIEGDGTDQRYPGGKEHAHRRGFAIVG